MDVYGKAVANIESTDDDKFGPNGGFTAVLSSPSMDRDGDRLLREEWQDFGQERYPLDIDHGMSVADTVGSFVPYWDGDRMMMDAVFARTPKAQEVRALVTPDENGIRHIQSVSVAFMTDKSKKDGEPRRELLNAGIVAIPSNRDAVILAAKAYTALKDAIPAVSEDEAREILDSEGEDTGEQIKTLLDALTKDPKRPYGSVHYADPGYQSDGVHRYPIDTPEHVRAAWSYIHQSKDRAKYSSEQLSHIEGAIRAAADHFGIELSKSVDEAETKAPQGQGAGSGDRAMLQAIHDASVHMGAVCVIPLQGDDDPTGADDGANKSTDEAEVKEVDEEAVEPADKLEAFDQALDEVLTSEESPAESPADEAASDEEPAPEAADDAAETEAEIEDLSSALRLRILASTI